jgi:hypothetical protein
MEKERQAVDEFMNKSAILEAFHIHFLILQEGFRLAITGSDAFKESVEALSMDSKSFLVFAANCGVYPKLLPKQHEIDIVFRE